MVSLVLIMVFFWILILFYPSAVLIVSLIGWVIKKSGKIRGDKLKNYSLDNIKSLEQIRIRNIDLKIDSIKELIFQVSVWLIFFIAAPFIVFCIYSQSF